MVITGMPWYDAMNAVRAARKQANPNFGFQRQLQNFEYTSLKEVSFTLFIKFKNKNFQFFFYSR
jgi:atypical dual specificity phosphatase